MTLWMTLLLACVPKARLLEEQQSLRQTEQTLQQAQDELTGLRMALAAAEGANGELTERTTALDARNVALVEQLATLAEELGSLGTRSEAQAAQKAALEKMVDQLQSDAEAARKEADVAKVRADGLAAERQRLANDAAKLTAEKKELQKQTAEYDALVGQLEREIASGQVTITELSGKLTVNMSDAILFDSGATAVKPAGKEALAKVAGVLATVTDREIRVEGHTDDVPVAKGASYVDNWGLSALRATTVVGLLIEGGVDPTNVAAVGYGEHHPSGPNDTKEARAVNRRTEIVLAPRLGGPR